MTTSTFDFPRRSRRRTVFALLALTAAVSLTMGATSSAGFAEPKGPTTVDATAMRGGTKGGPRKPPPSSPTAAAPTACLTAPDATSLAGRLGAWAGTIHTLYPYQGEIYYGYGSYGANTGSASSPYGTNVSSLNPSTGDFSAHLTGFKTEEVNTFRTIEGALYTPNIDPSVGSNGTDSFASDRDGVWAENNGTSGAVHLFDVAGANGDLLVAGAHTASSSANYRASVWLSTDGGTTWTESMSDTPANPLDRTGYERYYWMGTIGDKVYTRSSINAPLAQRPLRAFDTRTDTWSTVPDTGTGPAFGDTIQSANRVVSWGGHLWSADYGHLLSFDGTSTRASSTAAAMPSTQVPILSVGADGLLYAYASDGQVYRVDVLTRGAAQPLLVPVARVAPSATAFTVAHDAVWISTGAAQMCAYALPRT